MRLRVVIFEDEAGLRSALRAACARRGYEVLSFADPGLCPLHVLDRYPCGPGITCTDIILCDLNMPRVYGLDFVESLLQKQCAVPHLALMSGAWTPADEARAARLGCRVFHKPFSLRELDAWLGEVETQVSLDRRLLTLTASAWTAQGRGGGT